MATIVQQQTIVRLKHPETPTDETPSDGTPSDGTPAGGPLPEMEVLGDVMWGQDKFLGGEPSLCGKYIYGVPGSARRVMRVTVATGEVDEIGPDLPGKFKWLRAVSSPHDGCIYCMPSNADTVLKIDPATQEVTHLGGPFPGDWKWHGGCLGDDGNIYGIPANATSVLKINPRTQECSLVGDLPGRQKWYGGNKAANGAMYGIPQNAGGVVKIDPSTGEITVIGQGVIEELFDGGWKWHGGVLSADGKTLYGVPNNANHVLKINTENDTVSVIGPLPEGSTGRHRNDTRYKYLGGAVGSDSHIYFFPCDAERVLRLNTETEEVTCVGPNFLNENKWQNGFTVRDGATYAIPQRAPGILRVAPGPDGTVDVSCLDCDALLDAGQSSTTDKFESACLGSDGALYCMPLRAKRVLKVVPAELK